MIETYAACTQCFTRELGAAPSLPFLEQTGPFVLSAFHYCWTPVGVWLDLDDNGDFWAVCGCGARPAPVLLTTHHDRCRARALADLMDSDEGGNDGTEDQTG